MKKQELLCKLQEINQWYFEQNERCIKGEIKESTMKSYKSKYHSRKASIIKQIKLLKKEENNKQIVKKSIGIFSKWQ